MVMYYTTFYSVHNQSGKVTSMFLVKIPTFCCFMGPWINFFLDGHAITSTAFMFVNFDGDVEC